MSEEVKEQIKKILIYDSETDTESEEEEYIDQLENSSEEESNCECSEDPCECLFTINVITEEVKLALEMVDKIPREEEKLNYLNKLKTLILKEKEKETKEEISNTEFEGYDFSRIIKKASIKERPVNIQDLQKEIKELKEEINNIKNQIIEIKNEDLQRNEQIKAIIEHITPTLPSTSNNIIIPDEQEKANQVTVFQQKWFVKVSLKIGDKFHKEFTALMDSGADLNLIRQGLIPTQFYEKTVISLRAANSEKLKVKYKLPEAYICNKGKCFKNTFILTPDINEEMILGTPFLTQIYPFQVTQKGIKYKNILFEFISPIKNKTILEINENNFLSRIK